MDADINGVLAIVGYAVPGKLHMRAAVELVLQRVGERVTFPTEHKGCLTGPLVSTRLRGHL